MEIIHLNAIFFFVITLVLLVNNLQPIRQPNCNLSIFIKLTDTNNSRSSHTKIIVHEAYILMISSTAVLPQKGAFIGKLLQLIHY